MRHIEQDSARYRLAFRVLLTVTLMFAGIGSGSAAPLVSTTAAGPGGTISCGQDAGCVSESLPLPPMISAPDPRDLGPHVATYTVNTPGEPASGTDRTCAATCTLRQAINAANGNNATTITFDPAIFGTAHTITLSNATGFGKLVIYYSVTITGPGAGLLTIDGGCTDCGAGMANSGAGGVQIFQGVSGTSPALSLSGLTLAHGFTRSGGGAIGFIGGAVAVTNCAFTNNSAYGNGAAIELNTGTLTVTNSTFTSNVGTGAIANTVQNDVAGAVTVTGSTFTGNVSPNVAGAIYVYSYGTMMSTLTVTGSTFTSNSAGNNDGGAIYTEKANSVTIANTTFTSNSAGSDGGAISTIDVGAVMVTSSTFITNHAIRNGGAIDNYDRTGNPNAFTVTGGTLTSNSAGQHGGAVFSLGTNATLAVTGSTFTGNQATSDGGAINNNVSSTATITANTFTGNSARNGGAIVNVASDATTPTRLTLVNSTVSGNTTTGTKGGTVESDVIGATTVIVGSTITGNTSTATNGTGGVLAFNGALTLTDTISAGNMVTGGSPDLYSNGTGTTAFTGRNNLIGVGTGTNFTGLTNGTNGNRVGTAALPLDPKVGPLASNGGPVQTRALLTGSPAIDTGTCAYIDATGAAGTLTTDARGVTRPQGSTCDIGAFEVQVIVNTVPATHVPAPTVHPPTPTPLPQPAPMHVPGAVRGANTPTPVSQPTRH